MRTIVCLLMLSSIADSSALAGDFEKAFRSARTVCDQFVNRDRGILVYDPTDCCVYPLSAHWGRRGKFNDGFLRPTSAEIAFCN